MKKFPVDEPREIGKKRDRLSSKELSFVKDNLAEVVLRKKLKEFVRKEMSLIKEGVYDPGIFKAVFLAGGPGSGKSYVAGGLFGIPDKLNISMTGMKMVDQDKEYKYLLKKHGFDPEFLNQFPEDLFTHI